MNWNDPYQCKMALKEAAELGAASMAKELGVLKDEISQREAYRRFGEANVKLWVAKGLVKRIKGGEGKNSKVYYSLTELMAVQTAYKLGSMI
jgi:hypothetical protein